VTKTSKGEPLTAIPNPYSKENLPLRPMLNDNFYKNVEANVHTLVQEPNNYVRVDEILETPSKIQKVSFTTKLTTAL
jgi:hypothetical protein